MEMVILVVVGDLVVAGHATELVDLLFSVKGIQVDKDTSQTTSRAVVAVVLENEVWIQTQAGPVHYNTTMAKVATVLQMT